MYHSKGEPEMTPTSPTPLTPAAFQILLVLTGGERHGYQIMIEIARESEDTLRLGPTTLYRTIRTLLSMGLIEESDERPDPEIDDQRRRYYRLTPSGREAAKAETERLRKLVAIAETKPLNGNPFEEAS
jgi:DNA-binding PadR family transcriptional regulator